MGWVDRIHFKPKTYQTPTSELGLLFYKTLYSKGFNRFAYFAPHQSFFSKKVKLLLRLGIFFRYILKTGSYAKNIHIITSSCNNFIFMH